VNSDVFMSQPYYIIHASLGFKDPGQFSFYLSGHATEQLDFKQKPIGQGKGKMPRTFSHNSQMNATSSTPFYPGKRKVISKPMMQQISTYKGMNRGFPTSVSHGMLAGMNGHQPGYGPPPGLEKPAMSQNNLYRAPIEEVGDNWAPQQFQQDMGHQNNQPYRQWQNTGSQMIPSALQQVKHSQNTQREKQKFSSMKGSMSTEFNYNFGSRLIGESEDRFGCGFLENDSDSDDNNKQ